MNAVQQIVKWIVQKTGIPGAQAWLRGDDVMDVIGADRLVNPYANSVWVQRAIKRVAEPISATDLEFYTIQADGTEAEVKDPALAMFWKSPAADRSGLMDFADFILASVGWLKLSGECFWILDDTWLTQSSAASRAPMIVGRPDRMRPVVENGKLLGWIFTDANGLTHNLVREQVIHLKYWNPYDDLRGLSEWESARVASEGDYLAGKYALNVNRANGDRGVIVVAKGGMPGDDQREQIVRALREKAFAAKRGDFRPIFLTGDVAIEDPKIVTPDANFIAGRLQNRHEIFIAFGVPPSMADLVANYSIGQASDRYMLISETCIPLANGKLCGGIEAVTRMFNRKFAGVSACFDFDDHPVMQQVRRERIDTGTKLWDRGMPWDEISEHLDLGLQPFPGSDKGYVPFSVAEVAGDGTMEQEPAAPADVTEEGDEPVTMMMAALRATPVERMREALSVPTHTPAPAHTPERAGASSGVSVSDPERLALWNKHMRLQSGTVKMFLSKFNKVLMIARSETLAKIESAKRSVENRSVAADFIFTYDVFQSQLSAEMRGASIAALQTAGDQFHEEIGIDDPWSMPPQAAKDFLSARANLMTDIAEDVFQNIKGEIQTSLDEGDSIADTAKKIRGKFNDISKGRAVTIAKTETAAAYGAARKESMEQAGIQYKEWLTAHDDKVRTTHQEADGQIVRLDEKFRVGAEFLDHPCDGEGSPENTINCRCILLAATKPAEPAAP